MCVLIAFAQQVSNINRVTRVLLPRLRRLIPGGPQGRLKTARCLLVMAQFTWLYTTQSVEFRQDSLLGRQGHIFCLKQCVTLCSKIKADDAGGLLSILIRVWVELSTGWTTTDRAKRRSFFPILCTAASLGHDKIDFYLKESGIETMLTS